MADILAGAPVTATWDFPPSVTVSDATGIANIASTTFAPGTPEVGVTFVAPTSGRVLVTVGLGTRNNSTTDTTSRAHLAPAIYLGTSSAGTLVVSPDVTRRGAGGVPQSISYQYLSRTTLVTGLTAGATYYARTEHKASAANGPCDIVLRDLVIVPVP